MCFSSNGWKERVHSKHIIKASARPFKECILDFGAHEEEFESKLFQSVDDYKPKLDTHRHDSPQKTLSEIHSYHNKRWEVEETREKVGGTLDKLSARDNKYRVYKKGFNRYNRTRRIHYYSVDKEAPNFELVTTRYLIDGSFYLAQKTKKPKFLADPAVYQRMEKYPELLDYFLSCFRSLVADMCETKQSELYYSYVEYVFQEARKEPNNKFYRRHLSILGQNDPKFAEVFDDYIKEFIILR